MLAKLESVSQKPLIFVNVDLADEATVAFMESKGCEKTIEQYEMERLF